MSRMNSDQLHRSTLGIYMNLMDDFNPSLQKLVSLGNSYAQAFKALAATSEAYFSALSRIGEKAFHSMTSRPLGDVLIQISENQRRLTNELDSVFRWFSLEVLQEMDNNVRVDKDYLSNSKYHYEMEVHHQAAAVERSRMRGTNQDGEYVQFLRESHEEALKEEERRYRFLAEKHCGLTQAIANLMNKTGHSLQYKTDTWSADANATRQSDARRPAAVDNTMGMRQEIRQCREELPLGSIPSRAPSPVGSIYHSGADSAGGGGGGGRPMKARVAHQPASSSPTVLPFSKGEIITVLVKQPRNGWLYGRADSSSRQGWFPASYVEPVDDYPKSISSSNRGNSSSNNLYEQHGVGVSSSSHGGGAAPPPPPPPPPSSLSSNKYSEVQPITPTSDRRVESKAENKRSQAHGAVELFPRGTNPFATVKLKPTSTNDRSAPRLKR